MKQTFLLPMVALALSGCGGTILRQSTHDYVRFIDGLDNQPIGPAYQLDLYRQGLGVEIKPTKTEHTMYENYSGYYWGDDTPFNKNTIDTYVNNHQPDAYESLAVQNSPHTIIRENQRIYYVYLRYWAKFTSYYIDYHLNGGTFYAEVLQTYNLFQIGSFENLKKHIPTPQKAYCVFDGWVDVNGDPIDWASIHGDVSLYATWKPA